MPDSQLRALRDFLNSAARPENVLCSMLSLRQILAQHSSLLLFDSSSTQIQVGLFVADREPLWNSFDGEASTGLFSATEKLLKTAAMSLAAIEAFAFCSGPGSVLGIRTAAVALRTWNVLRERRVFSFSSLELVAHWEKQQRAGQAFSVIADARRDTWHRVEVQSDGVVSELNRVSAKALSGELIMPSPFRHWAPLPESVKRVPYAVDQMLRTLADADLFTENSDPDAFLHEAPSYLTWTPQIHRAPSPS